MLAAFFAAYVLFLYGPMIAIYVLSFQGPEGGLTFPMNGVSLIWFSKLFAGTGIVDIGAAFRRSLLLGLVVMVAHRRAVGRGRHGVPAFTLRLLEFLLGCCRGSCGGSAIALRFGIGGLLLLESRGLGLPFLTLGLVTCAKRRSGIGFGADRLSLSVGLAVRCRPGFGVNALLLYFLDCDLASVFRGLHRFTRHCDHSLLIDVLFCGICIRLVHQADSMLVAIGGVFICALGLSNAQRIARLKEFQR